MSGSGLHWAMRNVVPKCSTAQHVAVLVVMVDHMSPAGRGCYASQETIATESKTSVRTVRRCIGDFEAMGVFRRGDWRLVQHLRADRRPDVWDLAMDANDLTTGQHDLSSTPDDPTTGQRDRSQPLNDRSINTLTTGQSTPLRPVRVADKPVRTEPVREEPENQPPPTPASSPVGAEGEEVQEEGEGSEANDEIQKRAAAVLAELPFDRQYGRWRRQQLQAVVAQNLILGWSEDDLLDMCVGGLETANDRIACWMTRLDPEKLGPAPEAGQDDPKASSEPGYLPKCHRCDVARTITTDKGTARCPFCWGTTLRTSQERDELWDAARVVGIEEAGVVQPDGAVKRWPAPLAPTRVPKPRRETNGHQTWQDPDPSTFGAPKRAGYVGWQNPTEDDAYDGEF